MLRNATRIASQIGCRDPLFPLSQSPPFQLEFEGRTFQSERHSRFPTSQPDQTAIKTYLCPALVQAAPHGTANCVHKAIVIT